MTDFYFFYKTRHPFSQWHPCQFTVAGVTFATAEQFMMWSKATLFGDVEIAKCILETSDPRDQKALGRRVRKFNEAIWNTKAWDIVYAGNYAKFAQNEHLKQALLATGDAELVEASPYDVIWGIGMSEDDIDRFNKEKWRGTNWLGEVLTKLRNDLRAQE